jgi:hypothetical protein
MISYSNQVMLLNTGGAPNPYNVCLLETRYSTPQATDNFLLDVSQSALLRAVGADDEKPRNNVEPSDIAYGIGCEVQFPAVTQNLGIGAANVVDVIPRPLVVLD